MVTFNSIALFILLLVAMPLSADAGKTGGSEWVELFNGEDLSGWEVKVAGHPLGENPGRIFRVEQGLLTVSYDAFDKFNGLFGHLFTKTAYRNFSFRCEYRFKGEQSPGGPKWAYANSGIMLLCQQPDTVGLKQNFPDSIEFQFLGDTRTTGSLFTPGSRADHKGQIIEKSVKSEYPSRPFGEWVQAEAVVNNGTIQHFINGELVMEYTDPRLDDGTPMVSGHIALQAESHPCQFRNIEIFELPE